MIQILYIQTIQLMNYANQGLKMSLTNQGDSFAKILNFGKA